MDNILLKAIENVNRRDFTQEWGAGNRNNLVQVIERNGGTVTNTMWDMLLSHVDGLRINDKGKVCYLSTCKPSKRIMALLAKHNDIIRENITTIYNHVELSQIVGGVYL